MCLRLALEAIIQNGGKGRAGWEEEEVGNRGGQAVVKRATKRHFWHRVPSAWALHPKILQLRIKHMFASVIQFLHASVVCVNEYIYI